MQQTTTTPTPLDRHEAPALARATYGRFAAMAANVRPDQWGLPTDCEGWTVRDLVGHMAGAMRSAASFREMLRQQKEIKRRLADQGGDEIDIMTALQIELTADLDADAIVSEIRGLVEPATRGRARIPAPMRRLVTFPVLVDGDTEKWTLGYLVDVILTRDAWMHSVDLSRAVGTELPTSPDVDGRIVADVVAEWARRHGRPVQLTLSGPAGGRFEVNGPGGEDLELDAVDFCRSVSGRDPGGGLVSTVVPF